jgi:putative inorganic carbon (HCO3(-)) transporter
MRSSPSLLYLTRETGLILLLSYFILIGGGYAGTVVFESRFVTHVLAAFIVTSWLGRKALANEDFPATSLDIPISTLIAVLLLTTALSDMPRLSMESLFWAFMYIVFFYIVIDLLRRGWSPDLFVKSLLVVGGIACVLAALEGLEWYTRWFAIGGLADPIPPSSFRIIKTLGPNPLAAFLNLLIPFAVVAAVRTTRRLTRLMLAGWLLLALTVEFFTLSRGGWLGLFAALATLVIMLTLQYRRRALELSRRLGQNKILTTALIAATSIAALLICLVGYRLLTLPSRQGSLDERVLMWRSGWMAFVESPVTGTGPWTYGTQFLRYSRVDLRRPVEKAHNVALTILAESGMLGLAASLWVLWSVISSLRRQWLTSNRNQRFLVTAWVASLVGSLAHGMVEDFLTFPFFALTLVVMAAVASGEAQRRELRLRRNIPCRWLVGPILILLAVVFWTDISYAYFSRGASMAAGGRWEAGSQLMERATELDPGFPFYHFQRGLVYGHLAAREGTPYLDRALEQYEVGLSQEPHYSLNHANLAALYWQDGQTDAAIACIREAIELAPAAPDYAIQLGSYYEQLGSRADAVRLYETAITIDPSLIADLFWQGSELRHDFIADHRSEASSAQPSSSLQQGQTAYDEGRYGEAAAYFETILSTHRGNAKAHTGLGLAYLALGKEDAAIHSFRVAIFLGDRKEPHLALGRAANERGDLAEAIAEFENGLIQPLYSDFYGPGVYRREGIYQSRLPQLPHLGLTEALVDDYLELARMYEQAGATDHAQALYLMILELVPQYQPALRMLDSAQDVQPEE